MSENSELTPGEEKILSLILDGYISQTAIAKKLQRTQQAVNKTVMSLRKKGVIGKRLTQVDKQVMASPDGKSLFKFRLNGERFRIWVIASSVLYEDSREKANIILFGETTVELFRESVRIHLQPIYGKSVDGAKADSYVEFRRIVRVLESRLGIVLLKDGKQNIKRYAGEIAKLNDSLAYELIEREETFVVPDPEDGKRALLVDFSHRVPEFEAVHSERATEHMSDRAVPFFTDLLKNKPPVSSEIWRLAATNADQLSGLMRNQSSYAENIKSHVSAILELGRGVRDLRKEVRNLRKRGRK